MSSQRRIDSSRANGAKSRGPVTPEGRGESEEQFNILREKFNYEPSSAKTPPSDEDRAAGEAPRIPSAIGQRPSTRDRWTPTSKIKNFTMNPVPQNLRPLMRIGPPAKLRESHGPSAIDHRPSTTD